MHKVVTALMIGSLSITHAYAEETAGPFTGILTPLHELADSIPGEDTLNIGVQGTVTKDDSIGTEERISGRISVDTKFETEDRRDYIGTSIGFRADVIKGKDIEIEDQEEITTPFIGVKAGRVRENFELHGRASIDNQSAGLGGKAIYDLVENRNGGLAVAAAASFSEGGVQVGPGVELTGKRYGVMAYPTDILLVERAGNKGQYRNRYSLNPIIIAFNAVAGKKTSLHVAAEIVQETVADISNAISAISNSKKGIEINMIPEKKETNYGKYDPNFFDDLHK